MPHRLNRSVWFFPAILGKPFGKNFRPRSKTGIT
jgi:hypothetical protein